MFLKNIASTEKQEDSVPIKVTLPDGKEIEGKSWITSPISIAEDIRFDFLFFCESPLL